MIIGKKTIHQADALVWLAEKGVIPGASLVASMPDYSEFPGKTISQWKEWFTQAAKTILQSCPDDGVVIFYQRDSKFEGEWIDKAFLCQKAAELTGHAQLWHKIICRAPPGNITFGRPAYSHVLCFSKTLRLPLESATADVILAAGKTTWPRGMGLQVCELVCRFILENTKSRLVVAPFCGHGAVLVVANKMGMDGIGIELSRKRAERAQALEIPSFQFKP